MTFNLDRKLREVMSEVFSIPLKETGPGLSMSSFEGWDSLNHLNLVISLEETFGFRFDAADAAQMRSYADVRTVLARKLGVELAPPAAKPMSPPPVTERHPLPDDSIQLQNPYANAPHLDTRFQELVRSDTAFRQLASNFKVFLYRANGAQIGENVTISEGSCIIANVLIIGDGVHIGKNTVIDASRIYLGSAARVGKECDIVAEEMSVGDATIFGDYVRVDVAGEGKTSRARLSVGCRCSITSDVTINIARPVIIEDDVAISPGARLYTHSYWQSVLDGYSATFDGIRLGKNSWIGSGAQLMPGSSIGEGSTILANSTVTGAVEPETLVGGIPARPIKSRLRQVLSSTERKLLIPRLLDDFFDYLRARGCTVVSAPDAGNSAWEITIADDTQVKLVYGKGDSEAVSVGFNLPETGGPVLDMGTGQVSGPETLLSSELRNFLRHHGIRFEPIHWHYDWRKGLGSNEL